MYANLIAISAIAAIDYTTMRASAARIDSLACEVTATLRNRQAPIILSAVIDRAALELRDAVLAGIADGRHSRDLLSALDVALAWIETH